MKLDITNKIYNDVDAARAHLEGQLWPQGPFCPHCGSFAATKLEGKAHRPGLYQCNDCREQYTVTVGTVFERSKIGLHKWVLASHLIAASKKGMSSKQLQRMLGVTYKTAWFMSMRLREAMTDPTSGPIGGEGLNQLSTATRDCVAGESLPELRPHKVTTTLCGPSIPTDRAGKGNLVGDSGTFLVNARAVKTGSSISNKE